MLIIISISVVNSEQFGYNLLSQPTFNNNSAFVNSSENWVTLTAGIFNDVNTTQHNNNGGTLTIDESWLKLLGSTVWLLKNGSNADQLININNEDFITGGDITSSSLNANSLDIGGGFLTIDNSGNLVSSADLTIDSNTGKIHFGNFQDGNIGHNSNSLNIVANIVTAEDDLYFQADNFTFNTSTGLGDFIFQDMGIDDFKIAQPSFGDGAGMQLEFKGGSKLFDQSGGAFERFMFVVNGDNFQVLNEAGTVFMFKVDYNSSTDITTIGSGDIGSGASSQIFIQSSVMELLLQGQNEGFNVNVMGGLNASKNTAMISYVQSRTGSNRLILASDQDGAGPGRNNDILWRINGADRMIMGINDGLADDFQMSSGSSFDGAGMTFDISANRFGFGQQVPLEKVHIGGNLRVDGNINTTGNITSENVFIPQYLFAHNNATIPLVSDNVWENITFDQEDSDIKFGISHIYNDSTNQTFTINKNGVYEFSYNFDIIDTSVSANDIDIAGRVILINGSEILGSVFETDITKQNIEVELSHSFLVRLIKGDKFIFQFIADDSDVKISTHGTFGDHPESASIIIKKIANL